MESLDLDYSFLNEKLVTDYSSSTLDYDLDAFEPLISSVFSGAFWSKQDNRKSVVNPPWCWLFKIASLAGKWRA